MTEIDTFDATFDYDVIEQSKKIPVIVDFWVSWCGPCLILKPILEKIANEKEYEKKVVLAKFNVEQNPIKADEYDIMSIPAVKLFKNGKVVSEFVGARPERAIKEWIDSNL